METYEVKVDSEGTKRWYQNGKLHRLDGPAGEWADGSKFWYQNGKRHRLDGPAIELACGEKCWYIEGKEYTEEEFNKITNPRSLEGKKVVIEGIEYILS